jgi:D-sedoheptulose 7-phosphate isomerase
VIDPHIDDLVRRYPALLVCAQDIRSGYHLLLEALGEGGKLLLCGNGGSAADADHWSGELLKSFREPRPLTPYWQKRLGEPLGMKLQQGIPAVPLPALTAHNTAFANDESAEFVYSQLVWALGREGDALAAISTSGQSRNVIHAARVAREKDIAVLALTGANGGELAALADVAIRVPADVTHEIQELHLPVYHTLSLMLQDALCPLHKEALEEE